MLDYKLKIGLCPNLRDLADLKTRKGMFEPQKALDNKNASVKFIKNYFTDDNTEFCDLEGFNEYGMLYKNSDCERAAEYFKEQKIDALFIINCNFGNEEACGKIASLLNVPVLLWGPQDMVFEENGQRYTDCQCGLFAISKQLRRRGIPFTYIENCRIEEKTFMDGLKKFFSVACMVKNFKKLTVTQVGTRLNPFKSVMYNELELFEKFGINMQTYNLAQVEKKFNDILLFKKEELKVDLEKLKNDYDVANLQDDVLIKMLAFVYMYKEILTETGSDVLASECWTCMPLAFGANPCLAMSILYDMGYIVSCESDIHGSITSALLMCASRGKNPPIFGEFTTRHPENKNAELIWHCGPFPYSLKKEGERAMLCNTKPSFPLKDGDYTIARFQADGGKYSLLCGKFVTVPGPKTMGTHVWGQFKDLSKLEKKLINGPYIHHMVETYGDYTEELYEFCKYIPEISFDPMED